MTKRTPYFRHAYVAKWICAAALVAGCSGGGETPKRDAGVAPSETKLSAKAGVRVHVPPSLGAPLSSKSPGVIVRLKEMAAFEKHALFLGHGLAAAKAAADAQRSALRAQHVRIIGGLATKLGGMTSRRGHGIALGRSFDDFTDVLNGIALYGVDEGTARTVLKNEPSVLSIEPIREVRATLPESVPLIKADQVWAVSDGNGIGIDGTGMRIGILDTGVDYTNPDLGACFGPGCKVVAGYDFVNQDADPMDDLGHGTHVAATAAGNGTYAGPNGPAPIRGVAPGAQIYAYKVLNASGVGTTPDIIAAIERCADPNSDGDPSDHLDVCNLSLGGPGDPDDATSTAVDNATANGVVFAIAAGNGGPTASTIGSPGTSRRAITVAAACKTAAIGVDSRCALPIASFSSRGPVKWNGQTLAKPDVAAPGVSICAAEWGTFESSSRCLDGRHIALSGTSMATPHIAGVAALLRQAHPEWTPDQVKTFIVTSADSFGLDPSIQGSGMVDTLAALELGGLPSQIALVGGTPLRDLDVPTTRFATFSSDLTITNKTSGTVTFTGSFAGDAGLSVVLTPATFSVDAGATASVTVTRQVDHDTVPSGADARGTITFSSAPGNISVGLEVGVRPRLSSAPPSIDLGVDFAPQGTWTGQATLTLTNLRTDASQTYAATIACCDSVTQPGGTSVVASLDQSSLTLGPNGSVSLGVTVTATNGPLPNGRYSGSIGVTSPLGTLTIPVTFFKGYGLQVNTAPTPQALAVSSDQSGSSTLSVVNPSMTFYSTTPGPFYVEAVWPYGATRQHVIAAVNSDVPLAAVTLDPSQAIYTYQLQPRDQNNAALTSGMSLLYRFTHAASGGGVMAGVSISALDTFPIYVSALPTGIDFTAALVAFSGDPLGYLYELQGPVASDQVFTNTAADLVTKDVRLFRPGVGSDASYFHPLACLPWLPWGPPAPGGGIGGVRQSCDSNDAIALPTGLGHMRFYNSANRDLLAAPYPDAPSISYEILDGGLSGNVLYRGPLLYVSAAHPLTWSMIAPWGGTVLANQAYARFKCDDPPGNVLPVGPGPLLDQWSWWNHQTDSTIRATKGAFENPFVWGGCVEDNAYQTTPISYRLFHDDVLVQSATMAGNDPINPTLTDGQYRFEMTRAPILAGVTTQVETVSTFSVSSVSSLDENPPALRGIHLIGRGLWQDVIDPAVVDRLRFNLDPVAGFADANPPAATPPLFTSLADSLSQVRVQQGTDGSTWTDVSTTALGNGDYGTDQLDVDPTAPLVWFRISAMDLAGNTFRYTFQVPRGVSDAPDGADTVPPTTSITHPADGSTLSGVGSVTAVAADDGGVTEVDLLVDGTKIGASSAPPYTFSLDTSLLAPGPHVLETRAEDAAENVGYSAPIAVTTQNSDTTPPGVAFTAPGGGSVVGGVVLVIASASDDHQVARVELYDGTGLLSAPTAAPYSVSWDTATASAGEHTLRAVAYDAAGNAAATTLSVAVDNTPPTVTLTAPASGATVASTVAVTATATDNTAVARVEFYDGATLIATANSAPYAAAWNTSAVPVGSHTLKARAYDAAGNFGDSTAISVTVASDLTPPTVSIAAPAEGAFMGRYGHVQVNAADNVGVTGAQIYDGSTLIASFSLSAPPYGTTYDTTNVADGPHTLTARAMDAASNVGVSEPVHVTIDKVAPTGTVTSPASSAHVSDVVAVQATASDNYALGVVSLLVDNTTIATGTTPPFVATWNTLTWADGWHTVSVSAYDQAGNNSVTSIYVFVDNTVTPTVSSPASGALVGKTVPVNATTTNNAAVASLAFFDGATAIGTVNAAPFTVTWSPAAAGAHSLTVQATDLLGRVTTSSAVSVSADIGPPAVALTAPASGATVAGTLAVTATATDNTAIGRVEFYDGSTLIAAATGAPYAATWNTATVALGSHTLKARAFDTAGNFTDSSTVSVTVSSDVTPPTVAITSPTNGAVVTGTVSWTVVATDNVGVARVELHDGSTVVTTLTASPYTFNWNTTAVTAGAHTLTARALDAAGNSATSASVGITVDRTAPTVTLSAPASGATVSGVVTVSASASDNVAVASVAFYRDGAIQLGQATKSPYSISWDTTATAAGSHALTAIAYDAAGNAATSTSRSVTVKDVTAPAVFITSPTNSARVAVGSTTPIAATATDATGVTKVEFYVNSALTCTTTLAPYSCNWKVPTGTNKSYALVAKAYDAANNSRSSSSVAVTSK